MLHHKPPVAVLIAAAQAAHTCADVWFGAMFTPTGKVNCGTGGSSLQMYSKWSSRYPPALGMSYEVNDRRTGSGAPKLGDPHVVGV